jgi:transcriptional regulator with XRE-family HTH domain
MDVRVELGEFLQTRRARLRPEDMGLVSYGERRRVPGLRREELAQLAGVSVSYYTRLEQGQSTNASDEILEAIANALRLEDDERDYLMRMARPPRRRRRPVAVQQARPGIRQMLDAMADVPALLLGRANDVLAWNALGHALFAGHLDFESPWRVTERPNLSLMLFLDPVYRELYVDWKAKARGNVADLHWQSGQFPDDPRITAVVGELTVKSAEFSALWAGHPVRGCDPMWRDFRHRLVGMVTLAQEAWQQTTDPDQRLIVLSAEPGSPSEAALRLLGSLASAAAVDHSPSRSCGSSGR